MSLRLSAARIFLPPFLRKKYFGKLFRLTAEAFGVPAPAFEGTSDEARLRLFASFTRENALRILAAGNAGADGERLYRNARAFGDELRKSLGVRTFTEALDAARLLYRAIGIDFEGAPDGTIVIRSCRFAATYTPEICAFVSALDRGILEGLAGGGDLRFVQRLTDGNDACRAEFRRKGGHG
jgi:hypothetical protein